MKKSTVWLCVVVLLLAALGVRLSHSQPATAEASWPHPRSIGAFSNDHGAAVGFYLVDGVLVSTYTDGAHTWTDYQYPTYDVASLSLTVCGQTAYVFTIAACGEMEILRFDLLAEFPCSRTPTIYIPLVVQ